MVPIDILKMQLDPNNPAAPLDWRDRLAKAYVQRDIPCSRHFDEVIRKLWRFYLLRRATRRSARRAAVWKEHRALMIAIEIFRGGMEYLKPLIEAYLLTELDDAAIAAELHLPAETVHWYRLGFFDIERLRDSTVLIIHKVIGLFDERGEMVMNSHKLWKLIGYFLKSKALKKLIGMTPTSTTSDTDWSEWLSAQIMASVKFKQMIAVGVLKADNPKQNGMLLKLVSQECGVRAGREDDERGPLLRHIQSMIDDIPWMVGDDAKKALNDTKLGELDEYPAELRDDEVLRFGAGESIPDVEEEIRNLRRTPPTRQKPVFEPGNPRAQATPLTGGQVPAQPTPTKQVMPPGTVKPPPSNRQK